MMALECALRSSPVRVVCAVHRPSTAHVSRGVETKTATRPRKTPTMPKEQKPESSSRPQDGPSDRLRDAKERLTMQALLAHEGEEESARRYRHAHELNKALVNKQRQLRSLASALLLTEQRERRRLATELHDHLGQMMVLGRLKIGQVRFQGAAADAPIAQVIKGIDDIFSKSLSYIRGLMADLSPLVLYELGLPSALKWLAEQMSTQHHPMTVEVVLGQEHIPMPDDHALMLYHSVRELLLNVVHHARTSRARLVLAVERNERLRVSVHDNGQGFDPASLEIKSEPARFGLFSIQERMEAMGGSMHVDSAPGRGTRIALELPLTPAVHPQEALHTASLDNRREVVLPQTPSGVRRLLLVDDHAMIRQGLRAILDEYPDLSVVGEAVNGAEAVAMAAEAIPDVILMDINMPEMDGIEATKRIKAVNPAAIVIGLSVNNTAQVMEEMKKAGAAAFVSKDAAGEQLYETIVRLTPWSSGFPNSKAA
jgi:signal transduction histidine kinase/ActR/RegA family two-component response regulator